MGTSKNFSFKISGPFSGEIYGKNIIVSVIERITEVFPGIGLGSIELDKRLPVAAGLGGGSADVAAVLRAIARINGISDIETVFYNICLDIGADVLVCLQSGSARSALMWGTGELVWRPPCIARDLIPEGIGLLLVNPGVSLSTEDVFRVVRCPVSEITTKPCKAFYSFRTFDELVVYMKNTKNDLEKPAFSIEPVIKKVLFELRALPGCYIARMSGSGATCFGLFRNLSQAQLAKKQLLIRKKEPLVYFFIHFNF